MARQVMPEIDQAICILCGHCVSHCPHGALLLGESIWLDEALCSYCGDCEGICPVGAIALPYEIIIETEDSPGG